VFGGVNDVPWRELSYAYRGEADVPALFRALVDGPSAAEAIDELSNELYHQGGGVCSAAVAAMPYLVEAAASPEVRCRIEVLELLERLAATAREAAPRWVAPGWAEAWESALPRLLALLGDDDSRIRRAAAAVVTETTTSADTVAAVIRDGWPAQDRLTRLEQVLAVGSLAGSLTVGALPETLLWLRALVDDADEQVRLAAALALFKALPGRGVAIGPIVEGLCGELDAWSGSDELPSNPAAMVRSMIGRIGTDVAAREQVCLGLVAHPDPPRREGAVLAAADLLSGSRRPLLLPAVRELAADTHLATRTRALHLLAAHAWPDGADADLFAAALSPAMAAEDALLPALDEVAIWGLAWSGDDRCLPYLTDRLATNRHGYSLYTTHMGKQFGYLDWDLPGLEQLLAPCSGWATTLLPVIRRQLRGDCSGLELDRTLLQTLRGWGPAAASAVPQLVALLDGTSRPWAADAIGAVGPAAAPAAEPLHRLLRDPGVGLEPYAVDLAHETVPWAYFRVTGDPGPALAALGVRLRDRHTAIRRLADLGPHAAEHVPTLRLLAESREPWTSVEAAHALIQITGDPEEGSHVLIGPIRNLLDGRPEPIARVAATYLSELTELLPGHRASVEAVLDDDRRHSWEGGWPAVRQDLELRAHLAIATNRRPVPTDPTD